MSRKQSRTLNTLAKLFHQAIHFLKDYDLVIFAKPVLCNTVAMSLAPNLGGL